MIWVIVTPTAEASRRQGVQPIFDDNSVAQLLGKQQAVKY
jgi:hypothetical protein